MGGVQEVLASIYDAPEKEKYGLSVKSKRYTGTDRTELGCMDEGLFCKLAIYMIRREVSTIKVFSPSCSDFRAGKFFPRPSQWLGTTGACRRGVSVTPITSVSDDLDSVTDRWAIYLGPGPTNLRRR